VEDSPYQFSVLSDKEVKLLSGEVILLGFAEGKIYSNDDNTFYIQEFTSGEQYYYMTIPNQILYQDVDNLSIRITIATILVILLSVLFSNWYIMKKAQVVLKDSEESRSRYKEYAIKDTLTGAYSRRYLEKVREEWEIESAAGVLQAVVVVMDIDGFKGLNDQYGHEVGDEALRYLVRVILGNIRNNDILIRHGGDEFILIFKDCFQSKALEIMSRIKDYLELHDGFAHPIRISYGISEITNIENYDEVMRETDQKMYNDKRLKKAGRVDQPADEVTIKREHDDTEQKNDQG
ncbi:MAG: GGDEF domain-containing protein, partial [Lachnospiraceae bacterium]|nr:GGDEF domain-containing protein [Lachnospiraceae bacterium]